MFRIIGGDQQEYGPVDIEQIKRWIAENRIDASTRIRRETEIEWGHLIDFPELAELLSSPAEPPTLKSTPTDRPTAVPLLEATQPGEIDIGHCLSRGWALLRQNFALLAGSVAVVWGLQIVLAYIPFLGGIANFLLYGILTGGLCIVFLKRLRGEPATVGDVFSKFRDGFAQLMLVGILVSVLCSLGYLFCVLPGIFLQVAWTFAIVLVADRGYDFWPAMELSRRVVTRRFFSVLLLLIIVYLPFLLMNFFSVIIAMNLVMEVAPAGEIPNLEALTPVITRMATLGFLSQVVLLFTLPFATAALMYAYEDLFKSGE